MKGYTGFKFGEAMPYSPFGAGSTFTGAQPPSWLSGLSSLATPEEWRTKGTAFIRNPQMLVNRAKLLQFGREFQQSLEQSGKARMGDPTQAKQRAYSLEREMEEFDRLKREADARRMQSQMAFQPQMEAIRSGIMGRMAGQLGVNLPQSSQQVSTGAGYTPSWMRSYQTPSFPRY